MPFPRIISISIQSLPITKPIPIFLLSVGVIKNGTVSLNIKSCMTKKYTSHKKTPETAIIKPPNNMKVLQGTKKTLKSLGGFFFYHSFSVFICYKMFVPVFNELSRNRFMPLSINCGVCRLHLAARQKSRTVSQI